MAVADIGSARNLVLIARSKGNADAALECVAIWLDQWPHQKAGTKAAEIRQALLSLGPQ